MDNTNKKIPDFRYRTPGQRGRDTIYAVNSAIILGIIYGVAEAKISFTWALKTAAVSLLSYVVFIAIMACVVFLLQKLVGYTRGDSSISMGMFPTFTMQPPADLMTYDELRLMFYGEVFVSFVPCVAAAAMTFIFLNEWFITAAYALVNFALLFCFTEDGNLSRFGRMARIHNDYAAADNIARSIAIGYRLSQRERFSEMPKLLFVAPNEIIDMYDYRQSVFCYLRSMEIRDFKRAVILTERVIKSHYFEQLRGLAFITERNAVVADRILSLILDGDPDNKEQARKLYYDNSFWLTEYFNDNVVNMRCQTVQYAYAKLIAVNAEAQAKASAERFWEAAEGCNINWIVSFYAGLQLEIETIVKAAEQA